jgi:lysophospholipase L1-like esterase
MIAEAGLRAINYRPGIMDPDMYVANPDPLLPYKLQPNYQGYCAGQEVKTDAQGNRLVTPSYKELKPGQLPDRVVLLVGDSGVFGFGLGDSDTIGSQLQRTATGKNHNYEIRNIGVSGYTSWNEYQAVNNYLSDHNATDIIVLYVPNDVTFENDYFGVGKGKRVSFDRGETKTREVTRWLYSHVYVSYLLSDSAKRVIATLRSSGTAQAASGFDENAKREELDYSMEAIERLKQLCEERQIRFQVAIYRDIVYFDDQASWLNYERAISKRLDDRGIQWFIAKSHIERLPPSEIRVTWNDPHPSAKAAGLIADDLLNSLK